MRTIKTMAITAAALGMTLAGTPLARAGQALRLEGSSVTVPGNGYLSCKVTVKSRRAVQATVTLLDATGAVVPTEFESSYVASPMVTGDGRYLTEVTAGAFGDASQSVSGSCRGVIEGRLGRDAQATIEVTAYDAQGNPVAQ